MFVAQQASRFFVLHEFSGLVLLCYNRIAPQ
jgi:hypothetical protein